MQFITRPLIDWTRPATAKRSNASYSVGYAKTLDLLERELEHLGVKGDIVIQIDMPEGSIRRDGLPYADKRPSSPRVAVAFTGKHGAMIYRCDRYHDWQHNLRAISLGLNRLRLVDESGITSRGEQYTGFRALPPGIPLAAAAMTLEEAAREIATMAAPLIEKIKDANLRMATRTVSASSVIASADVFQMLYRLCAKQHHPDAGGADEKWSRVQAAADVLKKHHNIA